jgi:predicted glycoside hydrolase/deacetylase ChbG (UPF0249 family)
MRRRTAVQEWQPKTQEKLLIIHADDMGMSHSANRATIRAFETGAISSASLMMPCAWVAEAADWIKRNPTADVGLHLTLTSEWGTNRWRPVAPVDKVKGLLDPQGYMWRSVEDVVRRASPQEVETEIRAQVELALQMGLKPTHLDSHMGTLYADARFFEVFLKVAMEYRIPPMVFSPTPEMMLMAAARGLNYREVFQRIEAAGTAPHRLPQPAVRARREQGEAPPTPARLPAHAPARRQRTDCASGHGRPRRQRYHGRLALPRAGTRNPPRA